MKYRNKRLEIGNGNRQIRCAIPIRYRQKRHSQMYVQIGRMSGDETEKESPYDAHKAS